MAGKDRDSEASPHGSAEAADREVASVRRGTTAEDEHDSWRIEHPSQSPLFHAEHAQRYQRQELIQRYEAAFDCRLIVIIDVIFQEGIPKLEDLLYDADPEQDIHLILHSPGGDGEAAVRMVRSIQARCRELTVIVPDFAKSAGTILAMGAHKILMGPTSDLGPVDPQFYVGSEGNVGLVSAKDIIAAVATAEEAVAARPDTFPLHAALLSDVTGLQVQQARSALDRTADLVEEALKSNPARTTVQVGRLKQKLRKPLIDLPKDHSAVFGAQAAKDAGLPVEIANPRGDQWRLIWRLFAKYLVINAGPDCSVYEGIRASRIDKR